jgi:hypothetical protein
MLRLRRLEALGLRSGSVGQKKRVVGARESPLSLRHARAGRTVDESRTEMLDVVMPNDANPLSNILGGKVMHLIDIAGAVAAGEPPMSAFQRLKIPAPFRRRAGSGGILAYAGFHRYPFP